MALNAVLFSFAFFLLSFNTSFRHTALVCYDREFFYGGDGINSCLPVCNILIFSLTTVIQEIL